MVVTCVLASAAVAVPGTGRAATLNPPQVFGWGDFANGLPVPVTQPSALPSPAASGVRQLVSGQANGAAVMTDGTVQTWGSNWWGQLGAGTLDQTARNLPAPVPGLSGISQLAIGGQWFLITDAGAFMLAVGSGGSVWGWGSGYYGELGSLVTGNQLAPAQVPGLAGIVQVAAGLGHALALDRRGTVWAWGLNDHGQLGTGFGAPAQQPVPVQVPSLPGIVQVAAAGNTSFALGANGSVYVWGDNSYGLLGDGTVGEDEPLPLRMHALTGVTQIATSSLDALAVAGPAATVWAWGANLAGETGNGTDGVLQPRPVQLALSGVSQVAEGFLTSAAVLADGRLMVWGSNGHHVLGLGPAAGDQVTPVQNPDLTGVTQVAMGLESGLAIGRSTMYPVPDVRGDDQSTAAAVLQKAGFTLGAVSYVGVCASPGLVVSQSPAAGTRARPGSAVAVSVGVLKLCV
jgi:alpha-tubulin suppressor-like RCC1 family protein